MKMYKSLAVLTISIGMLHSAYGSPWPTGVADNVTVSTGQRIYIPVLANDSGSNLSLTEINTTTVALGKVEMNSSRTAVYYKSAAGYTGDDSFWYAFKDNEGRTNSTQVFLKVLSFGNNTENESTTNDYSGWPTANVDNVSTSKNTSITVAVLDNDIGDRLSLTEVNDWTVKAGRASIQGDSVVYTPKTNFVGQDSFWYNFVDARGRKNSTQVKVNVTDSGDQNEGAQTQGIADAVHIPMHVDFLKSQRFVWGEPGGTQSMKVTQSASAGSSQLKVSGGFTLMDEQLISYLSTDGQYYTVAISEAQGNTVYLRTSLPAPIAQWAEVWNFYQDGSHPNTIGFRSLVDFVLRNNDVSALNSGKHILLGDSWFSSEGVYARLTEKLDNANIVNLGVGGNTSQMLLDRFDQQLGNENPDFVWIIAGTNDYYRGVSVETFKANMQKLIAKVNAIGAKAMVFDSSVGQLMSGSNALTEKSHQYAKAIDDLLNQ
jgi:hypothetical protein